MSQKNQSQFKKVWKLYLLDNKLTTTNVMKTKPIGREEVSYHLCSKKAFNDTNFRKMYPQAVYEVALEEEDLIIRTSRTKAEQGPYIKECFEELNINYRDATRIISRKVQFSKDDEERYNLYMAILEDSAKNFYRMSSLQEWIENVKPLGINLALREDFEVIENHKAPEVTKNHKAPEVTKNHKAPEVTE